MPDASEDQAQKLLGALPPGKQQFAGAHDRKQAALLLEFVLRFTYLFLSLPMYVIVRVKSPGKQTQDQPPFINGS